jgi:hypothetical protein
MLRACVRVRGTADVDASVGLAVDPTRVASAYAGGASVRGKQSVS